MLLIIVCGEEVDIDGGGDGQQARRCTRFLLFQLSSS